jgi:hypothetical protein
MNENQFDTVKFESMSRHRTDRKDGKGAGHDSKQQRRRASERRTARRMKRAS